MPKQYYITTPIYYVNDVPHIGHAYTTIAADVLARWKRLQGHEVFFLTGTDEHGAKIAQAAEAKGVSPQAYADEIVEAFKRLWQSLHITHNGFIRTTEDRHIQTVQAFFSKLRENRDIYKGMYEDWYCTPCETFWSESELKGKTCPVCSREVERLQEESYFFKLDKYKDRLLSFYKNNPDFLAPRFRSSEIINFVKELKNLSVSRTKVKWGVPVPDDEKHTVYVWFDALINYISGIGYGQSPAADFKDIWPADVHFVGKEIFRFHAVIWPAMLMSLGIDVPKKVFAHGWWTVEGDKMSKSKGNMVDPHKIIADFGGEGLGTDVLRYFVLREVPFGNDGDFSQKALLGRYNAELANALGNLLNRTLNLIEKNDKGQILGKKTSLPVNRLEKFKAAMDNLAFHEALEEVALIVREGNAKIDSEAPWKTVKTDPAKASQTLHDVLISLKQAAILLHPFMPTITQEMWKQMGEQEDLAQTGKRFLKTGDISFVPEQTVKKGNPLFPRK